MFTESDAPSPPRARWEELFDELVELAEPERNKRLDELRSGDRELAGRLENLLAADAATAGFLDRPAPDLFGEVGEKNTEGEPQLPAGAIVGSWRVLGPLGRGGMGEVYLAERNEAGFA
ncbi:MAG TPA: hypothetical protein VHQ90_15515 [Thermoanaerobaculia bacterium]|nr:hypothetical protein [Thermoanaerobaculia bacterium]